MSTDASPAPTAKPMIAFFASDRVRAATVLGACIILSALIWTIGGRWTAGRYQISGTHAHAFMVDTATGRVWEKFVGTSDGPSRWARVDQPE